MDRRMKAMVETKFVSLLENETQQASKGKKTPVYQAVEKVVRRVLARGTVNEVRHMKVENLAKSQSFVQHFTSNVTMNPSFPVALPSGQAACASCRR